MSRPDKLDILKSDFTTNVLPSLIKVPTDEGFLAGGNYGNELFSLNLDMDIIMQYVLAYKPKSNSFVHFTSLKALHSILNEGIIRMYNLQNVNDPNEFSFTASQFGFDKVTMDGYKKGTYILSMCNASILESEDILTLWRLYGNEGRGCLIELEIIADIPLEKAREINLANVVYDELNYNEFFEKNKQFEERHSCKTNFMELIKNVACFQKKRLYGIEKEVRLVYNGVAPPPFTIYENPNLPELNYHREYGYDFNARGEIVSYYKFDIFNKRYGFPKIKVKRIQFGFKNDTNKHNEYKGHIEELYQGINSKREEEMEVPTIEYSPLKDEYF